MLFYPQNIISHFSKECNKKLIKNSKYGAEVVSEIEEMIETKSKTTKTEANETTPQIETSLESIANDWLENDDTLLHKGYKRSY